MAAEEQFDEFYYSTRHALVHQTFVLTGDLPAAQSAVRDSYVAAWHHWRKVASYDDPQDWVRPRAWQLAQRRHTARLWHRTKGMSAEHKAVLDAVGKLPVAQRKTLLLAHLAAVSLTQAAREVGVPLESAHRLLQTAAAGFAEHLEVDPSSIRGHLDALAETSGQVKLPRASIIRRAGRKRRRTHTVLATAAAMAVAVGSGAFVYQPSKVQASDTHLVKPSPSTPAPAVPAAEDRLPTAEQLLDEDQIRRLGMDQRWRVTNTHDNTSGDGINTICQQTRFADPDGISALVRTFEARGKPQRSAVQTIETSDSTEQAADAFGTTVGWYAGCHVGRLQLLQAYRVDGIGDQARVLVLRAWEKPVTTYSVAVARTGRVVTSTVGKTVAGEPAPPGQISQSLADAVSMLCARSEAENCSPQPAFAPVPPPPSGGEPGLLAVADLPPVGRIDQPWVGTKATPGRQNPAATMCDQANFVDQGATETRTRTFLVPGAKVPSRFGLSETYGVFRTAKAADRFMNTVSRRMSRCEDRNLATNVHSPRTIRDRATGTVMSTWILETEISEQETVSFRLGFVRLDDKVAQVNFAPTSRNDVSPRAFTNLVTRAGERLRELG